MAKRWMVVSTLLLIILAISSSVADAVEQLPIIRVHEPPSRSFPLKVYTYPLAIDLDNSQEFICEAASKIKTLFYDVLRTFPKIVLRFVDEYPEYKELALIHFQNTSAPSDAVIILKIVRKGDEPHIAYVNHLERRAEIYVKCELLEWAFNITNDEAKAENLAWSVIAHELGHALGLGHAKQMYTGDGHPELMYFGGFGDEKVYYSTLDLYAIYKLYFEDPQPRHRLVNVTLPPNLEYKMVVPYNVELRRLKGENEELRHRVRSMEAEMDKLWDHLRNASDVITYLNDENRRLREENQDLWILNAALEEQVADMWGQLQMADIIISRLQEENRWLKANLTRCISLGLELGEKCNQTIRNLVNEYNALNANYSVCLDYLAMYQRNAQWFKMWTWIMAATALIFALITYLVMKRRIRELEEELDQLEEGSS